MTSGAGNSAPLTTYDGGKNQAGTWQRIISLMPPHHVYVEAFLGSGAIMRRKRPAGVNVGIDADESVIESHQRFSTMPGESRLIAADAIDWLESHELARDALVYADPPYLLSTRSDQRKLYREEFGAEEQHRRLLEILTSTAALVIISGYESRLYEEKLAGWNRRAWCVTKRNGQRATEVVWFNYPEPEELHDYRFIGRDYHDRCRIWRKLHRWQNKLRNLPPIERNALISGILAPEAALRTSVHR